jgi:putative ABC transport system permease protein
MMKNKAYSVINITGLALGMAATILIMLFVQDELSYDKYHTNADRIYRVSRAWYNLDGEESLHLGQVAPPFGPLLKSDYEGIVEEVVRVLNHNPLVTFGDVKIEERNLYFADKEIFDVFSWEVVKGDAGTALELPNSIVITESTALKYFADQEPLGKTMVIDNQFDLKVTAIIKDIPLNSHFHPDFLVPMKLVEGYYGGPEQFMSNFGSNNFSTYLLLRPDYDYRELQAQMGDFLDNHLQPGSNGRLASEYNSLTLWPLTDIHLNSHLDSELEANGDRDYVYLYTIIAIFILIIACVNFINLSTARSAKRAREVGMRKVMGAHRFMLIKQFMMESIIYAVIALGLSFILVSLVIPWFNNFAQKQLEVNLLSNQFLLVMIVVITIVTGLIAGMYPAFFLSAFKPVDTIKGDVATSKNRFGLRSALVILQFAISIVLLVGVGVVIDQLHYVKSKDLGFSDHRALVLPTSQKITDQYESVKTNLLQQPGIEKVGFSSRIPSGRLLDSQGAVAEVDGEMQTISFRIADVHTDHDFLNSLAIPVIAGRDFDANMASDSTEAFVLNESAVRSIGWRSNDAAIGKKFNYGNRQGYIIGVVRDFHFESLHQEIAPIVFMITGGRGGSMVIRMKEDKIDETLAYLKEQWAYLRPGFPFTSFYIDTRFDEQYANEARLAELVSYFSGLAIVIAMLGLFGLASFTAEQRFKEIGIRKVLGASVVEILMLLTKGFTGLVLLGFIIAVPVAYYLMTHWLESFAYHGSVSTTTILLAGLVSILLTWITVGFQTIRAARANPINSIHYE